MIMRLKVETGYEATLVMEVLKKNGFNPVATIDFVDKDNASFTISFDIEDKIDTKGVCMGDCEECPLCTPDCEEWETCYNGAEKEVCNGCEEVDEATKEKNDKAVEEFLKFIMRSVSETATEKSRILNE